MIDMALIPVWNPTTETYDPTPEGWCDVNESLHVRDADCTGFVSVEENTALLAEIAAQPVSVMEIAR